MTERLVEICGDLGLTCVVLFMPPKGVTGGYLWERKVGHKHSPDTRCQQDLVFHTPRSTLSSPRGDDANFPQDQLHTRHILPLVL